MATIVEELIGLVGLEVDKASFKKGQKALDKFSESFDRVAKAGAIVAASGAAMLGFTAVTNKMTAEQERMAEAVNMSSEALGVYAGIAKQGGLDFGNVVDLVEELNNKMGESKGVEEMTAVKEATAILGLEFESLKKLKPEDQFFRILDAAQQLGDQQAAVSAADILMGGEANKFVGLLRTQDKGLQQLITDYKQLNFLTSEGRDSAKSFNKEFSRSGLVLSSITKQVGALLGKAIEPIIKAINTWISDNKELVQSLVTVFAHTLPWVVGIAAAAVGVMTLALLSYVPAVLAAAGATWALLAPILGTVAIYTLLAAAIGLVIEDIYLFIKYGEKAETVTGALWKKLKLLAMVLRMGVAGAFDYVSKKIDYLISKLKSLSGYEWLMSKFGGIETAVPEVSLGQGGGGGSTSNNSTTNNNSSVVHLSAPGMTSEEYLRIVETENANAARANSSGVAR